MESGTVRHGQIVGEVIGYTIGGGVVSLIAVCRKSVWVNRAHRLAATSNIELPSAIEGRVVRLLRKEYVSTMLMLIPVWILSSTLTGAVLSGSGRTVPSTSWYPWTVIALPGLFVFWSLLTALWPRWRNSEAHRVTHLRQLSPREAFTVTERVALWVGVLTSAGAASWGLWRVGAGVLWWIASLLSMGAAGLALRWIAQVTMNQSSAASDVLDLGWDDVLRFRRVRSLAVGAALGLPTLIVLYDVLIALALRDSRSFNLLLPVAPAAILLGCSQIFKQGQQSWRRAWTSPQSPQTAQ